MLLRYLNYWFRIENDGGGASLIWKSGAVWVAIIAIDAERAHLSTGVKLQRLRNFALGHFEWLL